MIPPHITDAHLLLRTEVRQVAREEIQPRVQQLEATGTHTDLALPAMMGAHGWFGILIGTEHSGMGAGHVARCILLDELSYSSGAAAAILQASLIPGLAIGYAGSEEQQHYWLPKVASGAVYPTLAVTEPEHGSNVLEIVTTATRSSNGGWVIDGTKCFIGNSGIGHLHVVIARTDEGDSRDTRCLSAFLVESDRAGVSVEQPKMVGMHGFTAGTVHLDQVQVPDANLLGAVGEGMNVAHVASIVCGRLNFAAMAVGMIRRVLDTTREFLSARPRYGTRLADQPIVRHHLGEMDSLLVTAQSVTQTAAQKLDTSEGCDEHLFNAKLVATRCARRAVAMAVSLHGGHAILADTVLDRIRRDVSFLEAPAGPDDIQIDRLGKAVIGRHPIQWSTEYARRPARHDTVAATA
ncbi:acyl-CoA dehydrogenase family protein [Streptomyces sp. 8L]|uniref:acyl-CoA dehydrogenase family protein n=1 Tax=Streptomyces sp. 8L TaxID=2877242 RepID=UPI001CD7F3D3|nr:acyl-CoA dehydrogenase family protein [Streptomyces sp. 8L]MCA1220047.1 acyl-CoA/acyl-ACP dehydrogenase [Streptomyces sp. 8L]